MELNYLAAYHIASDAWSDARVRAHEALVLAQETEQQVELVWALAHLAAIAALAPGDGRSTPLHHETVAQILGYVDERIAALGSPRQPVQQQEYDRVIAVLNETIGTPALRRLVSQGAALTTDHAVEAAQSL